VITAYGAPGPFFQLVDSYPNFRRMLVAICGTSQFLADLLHRDPGLLDGLLDGLVESPGHTNGSVVPAVWRDADELRRQRSQELLRIGTDDLLSLSSPEETFMRLSDLAESVLRTSYALAWAANTRRRGIPRDRSGHAATFACMAAGKFGGGELNFGSDLDLFFVYDGEGETGRGFPNASFFAEVAQDIIRRLREGEMYQVDARLRPEGRSAPVVITLPSYRRYLRNRAATWERLALCRARPVAGDDRLGARVMRSIQQFTFGGPFDAQTLAQIGDMRRRLEPQPERGKEPSIDIKRGAGGTVDVEFIAQILFLRFGRQHRQVRDPSTRVVLQGAVDCGLIDRECGSALSSAYDRLREVEKGMRMTSGRPHTTLPRGERELRSLARAVGSRDGPALRSEIEDLMDSTRNIYTQTLADLGTSTRDGDDDTSPGRPA